MFTHHGSHNTASRYLRHHLGPMEQRVWQMDGRHADQPEEAYQCTALKNNQRLVKALKGEAKTAVKSLLIHPSNVQAIMEQLRFRYGRPEQLIRSQLEIVRDLQPIQEHNIGRIVTFATRVSILAAFLQSTDAGYQHIGNPTLMEELIAKLPLSKRLYWAMYAATIKPYPTIVHMSEWLNELAKLVCTITDVSSKDPKRKVLHTNANLEPPMQDEHQEIMERNGYTDHPRGCLMCKGQHVIKDCKEFNNAPARMRMEFVKKHRICFACLETGHMSRLCKRSRKCRMPEEASLLVA
ncbi:uncharacterized protein LOC123258142 [Drosophila ananassae]|uniref:uncharacterized protein LOC123258142 n=1 Tax=Drosophila ananassae TaxID=7217 RepID=UPI001D000FA2|nr:uncharacterized protein LOC123258142 [Drosophila ananassae]